MKLREMGLYRARLPLVKPYRVSFRIHTEFEPIVVEVRDDEARIGWGEAYSPAGSSLETADSAWKFCRARAPDLIGQPIATAKALLEQASASAPNATTAMMTAIEMLERPAVLQVSARTAIPLLKVVASIEEKEIESEVERHIAEGYRTLKVKVGWNVEKDLARVGAIAGWRPASRVSWSIPQAR